MYSYFFIRYFFVVHSLKDGFGGAVGRLCGAASEPLISAINGSDLQSVDMKSRSLKTNPTAGMPPSRLPVCHFLNGI